MLTAVEIRKFRTCQPTKFKLNSSVSALIGQNGAGKTNILQAIKTVAKLDPYEKVDDIDISLELEINHTTYVYSLRNSNIALGPSRVLIDSLKIKDSDEVIFKKHEDGLIEGSAPNQMLPPMMRVLYFLQNSENSAIQYVYKFISSINYYHIHDYTKTNGEIIDDKEFENWRFLSADVKSARGNPLFKLYDLNRYYPNTFNEIVSILNDIYVIDSIDFISLKDNSYILPIFKLNKQGRQFHELSEGTKRVISILLNMFYDKSSLMLIEEPESSIHHGLLVKLVDILRAYSDEHQVIFSTHSDQVLNELKPKEIIFVKMEKNKTVAKNPPPKQIKEIKYYLDNIGPLGEYITTTGGGELF
ncbi:MAG: ATP-binding protein [Nitrospirae bacterium]|nr:ATP-binding protein [Nitrospirota bacterium]